MESVSAVSSETTVIIRAATIDDIDAISAIYNYYVLLEGDVTTFEEEVVSVEEMRRRYNHIATDLKFPFLVAYIGDVVVGYAYGNFYKERVAYRYSAESSIYLNVEYQRCGVGTTLLTELLSALRKRGCKQVIAIVGSREDNPGSYRLHEKLGYKHAALYKNIGWKHGRWVDRVHLQLSMLTAEEVEAGPGDLQMI